MSDINTFLEREHKLFINGEWVSGGSRFATLNPATGQPLATVVQADESDVDQAVEGLPPRQFLKACGQLERATHYAFDLVPLENASSRLREQILKSGILVYDSSSRQSTG